MSRIRTVKPEFFRHEGLQELGAEAMLVFSGLWTKCDNRGRFIWSPRHLKLDILPFMPFDMESTLDKLRAAGFINKYKVDGKLYGIVPTFRDHQRITGRELTDGEKYPGPIEKQQGNNGETTGKQQGSNEETTGKQPVSQEKEREKEKEKEQGKGKECEERENQKTPFIKTEKKQNGNGGPGKEAFLSSLKPIYENIFNLYPNLHTQRKITLFVESHIRSGNPKAIIHTLKRIIESKTKPPDEKITAFLKSIFAVEDGKFNATESERISNEHKHAPINMGAILNGIGRRIGS